MTNLNVKFSPAEKTDCKAIASLYSISSDGLADYVWTQLAAPGEDILTVGQRRYERENTQFSYQNCTLATVNEAIVGMMVAFPMVVDSNAELESDPVSAPYSRLEVDNSYYICGVALFPDYCGQGIGTQFMELAEATAIAQGFCQLSLIVFEQNVRAKKLYDRLHNNQDDHEAVVPHPLIHFTGDAILMVKKI